MRYLILLPLLLSCARIYTEPEIGVPFNEFAKLCNVQGEITTAKTVTNTQSSTLTIKLTDTPAIYPENQPKRDPGCIGIFTFVNGKLDSISR